jgi:hypothetical protein
MVAGSVQYTRQKREGSRRQERIHDKGKGGRERERKADVCGQWIRGGNGGEREKRREKHVRGGEVMSR